MSKKAVFCVAASEFQAVCIVDRLKDAGFLNTDTSLLFADKTDARDFGYSSVGAKAQNGVTTGVVAGAMLSGAVGWLLDAGAFALPGVGPVVAAGPISTALSAAMGIPGTLITMGIPEYEARRYEGKIKQGGILIAVRVKDVAEAQLAEEIFKEEDAQEIASSSEIIAPKQGRSLSPPNPQPIFAGSGESIQ